MRRAPAHCERHHPATTSRRHPPSAHLCAQASRHRARPGNLCGCFTVDLASAGCHCRLLPTCSRSSCGTRGSIRVGCSRTSRRTSISGNRRHRVGRFGGAARPFGAGVPASSSVKTRGRRPTRFRRRRSRGVSFISPPGRTSTGSLPSATRGLTSTTSTYRVTSALGLRGCTGAQDDFIDAVDGLSAESVFEPRPAHWGESVPVVRLVTTMLTEHVHHIAEIGVLRDLRRGHALSQPPPPPIARSELVVGHAIDRRITAALAR